MRHGIMPVGTSSHQYIMIPAALTADEENPDQALLHIQQKMMRLWWETYGKGLSVMLPDTYGTPACLDSLTLEQWQQWKGIREDSSADPVVYGDELIRKYESRDIDPRTKLFIPSNGLDVITVVSLAQHFQGRMRCSSGLGTTLTNDWGLPTRSVVIKPWRARRTGGAWHGCVKISDNRGKAIGTPEDIARYMRVFDYSQTYSDIQDV